MRHHQWPGSLGDVPEPLGTTPFRLLIVADVRLYREGMHASLATRPNFEVIGSASSVEEALSLMTSGRPHVAIIDMATRQSLDIARTMRRHDPTVAIVGFGIEEVLGEILACAEAGLAGYVPNDASLDDLVRGVESVCRGELLCNPRIAAALFRTLAGFQHHNDRQGQLQALTGREREVLHLIDGGLSNKQIATALGIELSTVKNHVHNLLEKLRVTSRMQAAARLGTHLSSRQRSCDLGSEQHLD